MKTFVHIHSICLFLVLIILLHSCKDDPVMTGYLQRAQDIAESNPTGALALLDSIAAPEKMGKDNYMKYIVTRVHAKYKSNGDITGDTLIFEARRYFNEKNDAKMATLANLYTGNVYYERKIPNKALDAYLDAEHYGRLCDNNLMLGKTLHNIGNLYYEQNILDSAMIRFKDALKKFNKTESSDIHELHIFKFISLTYYFGKELDSSYLYSSRGLDLAYKIKDSISQISFKHQLGFILREKGEYTRATAYLNDVLRNTKKSKDSIRVYLNISKVYNAQKNTDSAGYYLDYLKKRLPQITYNYTLESIYGALAEYESQCGNMGEAYRYMCLRQEITKEITEANDKSYMLFQSVYSNRKTMKQQQAELMEVRYYLLLLAAFLIIVILILAGYSYYQKHKKELEKNRALKIEYELLDSQNKLLDTNNRLLNSENKLLETRVNSLILMYKTNQGVSRKWDSVNDEIDELASQFGITEKPSLIVRIEEIIKSLQIDINKVSENWVYDYLGEYSIDKKAISSLSKNELLLLLFCGCKYSKDEIADLLEIPSGKVFPMKLNLKHKLLKLNIPEPQISRILCIE